MRLAIRLALIGALGVVPSAAWADGFAGFSAVSPRYQVDVDRVCTPLPVIAGRAKGTPACERVPEDRRAALRMGLPPAERGAKATVVGAVVGGELQLTRGGAPLVAWKPIDPVLAVRAVYASTYGDMVAVEYTARALGREDVRVVGFAVGAAAGGQGAGPIEPGVAPPTVEGSPAKPPDDHPSLKAPLDPGAVSKAVKRARAKRGAAAIKAWDQVLALDPWASEAIAGRAAGLVDKRRDAEALTELERLAGSLRVDAVEHLVAARFDKRFARLRADARYRVAVGLDRGATSAYERVLGYGGAWEQAGVPCDQPTVAVTFTRARAVSINVRTICEGQAFAARFKGTWQLHGEELRLSLPNRDRAADIIPCQITPVADEHAISCQLDDDLRFTVLPIRR